MQKTLVTTIAALTTAMLFNMTSANASIYKFTFQSSDAELTATGEFTVDANDLTGTSGTQAQTGTAYQDAYTWNENPGAGPGSPSPLKAQIRPSCSAVG